MNNIWMWSSVGTCCQLHVWSATEGSHYVWIYILSFTRLPGVALGTCVNCSELL